MKKENEKIGEIRDILALCEIIDEFEEFNKNIMKLFSKKDRRDISFELWKISQCNHSFKKEAKSFYKQNKDVIDKISKYQSINMFIINNYDDYGNLKSEGLGFFYPYIKKNKEHIEKIKELLIQMKQLSFTSFTFDENFDVKDQEYVMHIGSYYGHVGDYVDNIEIIPSYSEFNIRYKSNGSNYLIKMYSDFNSFRSEKLIVNSLLFDKNRLPESINKQSVTTYFRKLYEKQEKQYQAVKNSVDLTVGISDLQSEFYSLQSTIGSKLQDVYNKQQLLDVLKNIKEEINKLTDLSSEYDKSITSKYPNVTEEILKDEVKLYIKRREDAQIDDC